MQKWPGEHAYAARAWAGLACADSADAATGVVGPRRVVAAATAPRASRRRAVRRDGSGARISMILPLPRVPLTCGRRRDRHRAGGGVDFATKSRERVA